MVTAPQSALSSTPSESATTTSVFSAQLARQQHVSSLSVAAQTADASPLSLGIHQLFEAQAEKTPHASAVVFQKQALSYDALNKRANQLAHTLIQWGIGPGSLVAVSMPRTPEVIVAILGVLKAGAAYVPIDPAYPAERRNYILQDSKVAAMITPPATAREAGATVRTPSTTGNHLAPSIIQLDGTGSAIAHQPETNPNVTVTPENLAYIIYTSGSTGNPKGVMVKHQGVVNHALAIADAFEITSADRALQFSSLSFDIVVEEIYPTLISGATLVLRPEEIATSLSAFLEFTAAENLTILNIPTAFWHELVAGLARRAEKADQTTRAASASELSKTVRLVVVGGEKASRAIYAQWRTLMGEYPRWLNAYGPTEATVTSTLYDPIAEGFDLSQELPIGRPIANTNTYVLDSDMQPVAPGEAGELFIGGLGLARGYLNLPEKTTQAFVAIPPDQLPPAATQQCAVPDRRLYRTGDIVHELPDGNLAFVGRADFQVKIRGFRIELGEIENCLEKHAQVQQQIVIAREMAPGEKQLVAYVVLKEELDETTDKSVDETTANPSDPQAIKQALQAFLHKQLPQYMVPSAFVFLKALPITPNGKVDRKALPAPMEATRKAVAAPQTALEETLVESWKTVLGIESVGVDDNFFELGGSSLKAVHLFSLLEEKLDQKLPLATMLQAPTITRLAEALSQPSTTELWDTLVPMRTGDRKKPPLFFLHAVGPSILNYQNLLPYLDEDQPVYAVQAKGLDESQPLLERMDLMAAEYIEDIKKLQPEGPYYLVGHSFGGMMAFEMAQQLHEQGDEIGLLGLIDTSIPSLSYCQTPPLVYQLYIHLTNCLQAQGLQGKWQYLASRAKPILQKLINRGKNSQELEKEVLPEIYRRIETIDREALKRYSPQVYSGTMTLFRAQEKDPKLLYDEHLGWRYLVEGGLDIRDVPGNHLSVMFDPNVEALATALQTCLDQTRSDVVQKSVVQAGKR